MKSFEFESDDLIIVPSVGHTVFLPDSAPWIGGNVERVVWHMEDDGENKVVVYLGINQL